MRRRSQNKTIAISITLDRNIIDELDEILSAKQSRSKFIQKCIEGKLNNGTFVYEADTKQLMVALSSRADCDEYLRRNLLQILLS
jgi:metal-responsive CopG/Arc/MetJ family transcriptional regulator